MVPDTVETPRGDADFESWIAELSSRLIGLAPTDVDREINEVLRGICTWFDIDFAVLWQWSIDSPDVIVATHYHYAEGGRRPPEALDQRQFPWYRQQMQQGTMIAIASLDELPPEAATDREYGNILGIKSNLNIPLAVGGEHPVGALALNVLRKQRAWSAPVIRRAQLISQLIATALARQKSNRERREVEDRLKMAVDAAGAGLWTLDDHTGAIWASPHARAMFGYPPGETINRQRFEASIHPDDRRIVNDALERSRRTGEAFAVEYRVIVSATNGVRWVASRGRPTVGSDAQGRRLMGISLDVTEQRLAAEELRANSARLQAGTDLAGLGFYVTDYRTGVMTCDDRFCDLLGIADAQRSYLETTRYWAARLHPEDRLAVLQARDRLHSGEAERVATEYRYSHPTRGEIWVDHLAAAVERDVDGRLLRNIGVVRDIGSQKRAELGMREMSQRLLKAQEQERALIARELHDDLSQRLAVLSIEAARAEGAADEGQAAALRSIREGLVRLSEDVHSLAYQLHPSVLEELGLAAALRAECERRARQGGPELSLAIEPLPDGIGNEAELCLFRVAQEALTNAIRHAGAGKLQLQLRLQGGGVLLAVCDDGLGFDVQQMTGRGRLGLASMRERMRIVNGTLDIESAPGSGTTVVAWAPLAGDAR